jgi:prepilin-type N-terminal cleavage/methylation domain-containing protein
MQFGDTAECNSALRRGRAGFTLIEVVISSALMAMIIVAAYLCLNACVASQKAMEPRLEVIQNARVAMALMAADLRAACPLDKNSEFLGMPRTLGNIEADNLDFATHNYTPRHAHEGDFCEESFYLSPSPETGAISLYRRRNPRIAPDPLNGGSKEEIARNVLGLRFEYYDGLDWYESWGDVQSRGKAQTSNRSQPNLTGMPEAVRITLWLDSNPRAKPATDAANVESAANVDKEKHEPPLVFQTIARLNLRSASQSGTTDAGGGGAADTGGQTQPVAQPGGGGY